MDASNKIKILRLSQLIETIGISRSSIYNRLDTKSKFYDSTFPKPISLSNSGRGSIGWLENEVQDWLNKRVTLARAS